MTQTTSAVRFTSNVSGLSNDELHIKSLPTTKKKNTAPESIPFSLDPLLPGATSNRSSSGNRRAGDGTAGQPPRVVEEVERTSLTAPVPRPPHPPLPFSHTPHPIVPALEAIWQNSAGKGLADFNFRSVTGNPHFLYFFILLINVHMFA